jgi:hypothetical protein
MKKTILLTITLVFVGIIFFNLPANATSGACSWHDGVDCNMGRQTDGTVYCNDGWKESIVEYDYMVKCNPKRRTSLVFDYCKDVENFSYSVYRKERFDVLIHECLQKTCTDSYCSGYKREWTLNNMKNCSLTVPEKADQETIDKCKELTKQQNKPNCLINSHLNDDYCICNDGYKDIFGDDDYSCVKNNCPSNTLNFGFLLKCTDGFINEDKHCCDCQIGWKLYNKECIEEEDYNKRIQNNKIIETPSVTKDTNTVIQPTKEAVQEAPLDETIETRIDIEDTNNKEDDNDNQSENASTEKKTWYNPIKTMVKNIKNWFINLFK